LRRDLIHGGSYTFTLYSAHFLTSSQFPDRALLQIYPSDDKIMQHQKSEHLVSSYCQSSPPTRGFFNNMVGFSLRFQHNNKSITLTTRTPLNDDLIFDLQYDYYLHSLMITAAAYK
jgi:hypothetical protein